MSEIAGGSLSRIVPAHTRRVTFRWIKREFMTFYAFKTARVRMRQPILQGGKCYWCHNHFLDDDIMALAGPEKGANKLLCQKCVGEITPATVSREQTP